jgi:arylsulfatase
VLASLTAPHVNLSGDELDGLGLASNTIIVLTADHGDLDGAHRLHSKGATAYREQNNVPLIVVHSAHPGANAAGR